MRAVTPGDAGGRNEPTAAVSASSPTSQSSPAEARARWRLGFAAAAVLLAAADTYVVVLALPSIMGDLGLSLDHLEAATPIVSGFLLGYVALLPLLGRLSDILGRGPVFAGCLLTFAFGSLITASSQDLATAVAGRALQGVGGGGLVPDHPRHRRRPLATRAARDPPGCGGGGPGAGLGARPALRRRHPQLHHLAADLLAQPAARHPAGHRLPRLSRLRRAGRADPPDRPPPGRSSWAPLWPPEVWPSRRRRCSQRPGVGGALGAAHRRFGLEHPARPARPGRRPDLDGLGLGGSAGHRGCCSCAGCPRSGAGWTGGVLPCWQVVLALVVVSFSTADPSSALVAPAAVVLLPAAAARRRSSGGQTAHPAALIPLREVADQRPPRGRCCATWPSAPR